MRKSISLILFIGLPAVAQVAGGHETVQDAIRFERQKDLAAARQARMEGRRTANSSADRVADDSNRVSKSSKAPKSKTKSGSAARSNNSQNPR